MTLLLLSAALAAVPATSRSGPGPHDGMIKVAIAISEHVNLMDVAGPWEVFGDTSLKDARGEEVAPYEVYTVAPTRAPLHTVGANRPGIVITPDFDFAHAPEPDLVVVPAQSGGPELVAWLKQLHARHVAIMSVCTGAFQLAEAGLLDGERATTHHWYFGNFQRAFPRVKLVKQVRYVQSDPDTFTSGGLTSGVDLALHLVAVRFGQEVAQQTADYMEYLGTGWKTNQGISPLAMPVTHQAWSGKLAGGDAIVVHMTTFGASPVFTLDIPAQHVHGAPVVASGTGGEADFSAAIPNHAATFKGKAGAGGAVLRGTFVQDGRSSPLTLTRDPVGG